MLSFKSLNFETPSLCALDFKHPESQKSHGDISRDFGDHTMGKHRLLIPSSPKWIHERSCIGRTPHRMCSLEKNVEFELDRGGRHYKTS